MMAYEELKEIAERYGIAVSQKGFGEGGFIDSDEKPVRKSILSDVQLDFGILTDGIGYKSYEIDSVIDLYAA
ncbi:MAG TPA: hypothetical protein DCZ40_02530 [Lachnospiraceae bacterium]|nr:hypothetical protein [Lachnospiraceae bacterium]